MAWGSVQMAISILAALDYLECGMPLSRRRGSTALGVTELRSLPEGRPPIGASPGEMRLWKMQNGIPV